MVYADAAARDSLQSVDLYDFNDKVPEWNDEGTMTNEEKVLITQSVKRSIGSYPTVCGHRTLRSPSAPSLGPPRHALHEETERLFKRVKASRDIYELRNMINVGYLITRWALERKECREACTSPPTIPCMPMTSLLSRATSCYNLMSNKFRSFSKRLTKRIIIVLTLTLAVIFAGLYYLATSLTRDMNRSMFYCIMDTESEIVEKELYGVQLSTQSTVSATCSRR